MTNSKSKNFINKLTKSVFTKEYRAFRLLIIEYRISRGISQIQMAKELSRPQSHVSKYESGERRLDLIEFRQIAHILNIDILEFFTRLEALIASDQDI